MEAFLKVRLDRPCADGLQLDPIRPAAKPRLQALPEYLETRVLHPIEGNDFAISGRAKRRKFLITCKV